MSTLTKEIAQIGSKTFIGISMHIEDQNEETSVIIGKFWDKFFAENILEKIPNKIGQEVYGVYSNVKLKGEHLSYTLTCGAEVEPETKTPEGMNVVEFPEQKYMKFTTPYGPMPKVCIDGWMEIWDYFHNKRGPERRSFTGSFELYDERMQDPENGQMDFFISVR